MVRGLLSLALVLATVGLAASDTLPRLFPSTVSFIPSSASSSSLRRSHRSHHRSHFNKYRHSSPFNSYAYYQHSKYYQSTAAKTYPSYPGSYSPSKSLPSNTYEASNNQLAPSSSHLTPQPLPMMVKTARFVVVSEGMYDHDHHVHAHEKMKEEKEVVLGPHFAGGNTTSTRVFLGNTVTLDCTVHDLTNESVSWMRSRDDMLELITWDSNTYAKDDRYSLVREQGKKWRRWQLVIRNTRADDQGQYRCQVATQPPLILVVNLNVTVPVARVVDERGTKVQEKHYNSGSMIELKCIVDQVPFPHGPVTWRRGTTILTYNTSRGGISVKGNEAGGYIRSRLYVADATPHDSGFYSCWYKNITSDTVTVHVIAGENSAAMQHDGLPGSGGNVSGGPSSLKPSLALPFFLAFFTVATWVLSCASSVTTGTNTSVSSEWSAEGITWRKQQEEE
ncbi:uncharacterized protein LOC123507401, partial [Portunus trituberculatus]|uniref:uncharacterized protein LOC123507401 n=1 Tax=Portunus trituberculatus TaxID=210409 RepID=UPI001E1CFE05